MAPMRPSRRAWPWLLAAALILGSLAGASAAAKERSKAPHKVSVELISELDGIEPGATFWVGLRQRIAPGWHTY
jgi:DsbC/DsbD-like thiol-disulfide interchange protein